MLVAVLRVGANVKGAQARFDIGPFQLQPGEFAKLFLILVLAGLLRAAPRRHDAAPARRRAGDLRRCRWG